MIKLLIADDEHYERESIINILDKSFKNEFDISQARNGREAIEVSERVRPEIIIMDIKMPGINGLNAIQEIRKFIPNVFIIILTAYDYFDFAVEALKSNVKDYILKPFGKEELSEKVKAAISSVNSEREKRKKEIEDQERLYNLMPVLENELCYSIITNSVKSIDHETYSKYLNINFQRACSMVAKFKEELSDEHTKYRVGDYVKEYINRRYRAISSYKFTKDLFYILEITDEMDEYETRFSLVNLASDIRREVKRVFDVSIRIGIGKCYSGIEDMHKSCQEASSALDYITENTHVVHYQDIESSISIKDAAPEKLQSAEKEKIALFKRVEQYIADNLKEELDLEETAAQFNLSSYYFSRSFKEAIGYNFTDYINMMRIKKAKELIKSDSLSIKEVGYSVGFSDPNYFSKVFKKYEGISPTEYKSKLD